MSSRIRRSLVACALVAPLATFAASSPAAADDGRGERDERGTAAIYTETNAPGANAVLAFRNVGGSLTSVGSFPTGGAGLGVGLGSQGSVIVDNSRVLAVNAGSNQVSLFSINNDGGLTLRDVEPSGGVRPVSVTVHDDVAYVVNAGNQTVSGFRIRQGHLDAIAGSTQTLPGNSAAQIQFDNAGRRLIVTEKGTNTIDVLGVDGRGVAGAATSNPSTGATPFGFAIDHRDHLIVSNAAGGAPGASSVSSYDFAGRTGLSPVSSAIADTQGAACWIALASNEKFAYTTNTASGSISSYRVARDGSLVLLNATAAFPGGGPTDMVNASGTLFTLNTGAHTITGHRIAGDGSLVATSSISVPAGVTGLASA